MCSPELTGLFGSTIVAPPITTWPSRMRFFARLRLRSATEPARKESSREPAAVDSTVSSIRSLSPLRPSTMVQPSFNDDEAPLDPALERVQARMRRLMLIAGLTLGLGIFAVFGAILYKIATSGDRGAVTAGSDTVAASVSATLPAGARLVSTTSAGNRLVLTYEHQGGTLLIFVDPRNFAVVGRLDLKPE